ncbi:hypothetical protein [Actinospica robiniae]|uniref:hypothetical protein n=1 Tax=Actinospica robiniae TaxID=304901 RepID=UPI0012FC223F
MTPGLSDKRPLAQRQPWPRAGYRFEFREDQGHDGAVSFIGQSALFTVTVRPARAAYLIAEESLDGFRRAVQEASERWGGQTELIIPVRDDGTISLDSQRMIELSHVDGLVNIDAPVDHAKSLADSFGMHLTPIKDIDSWGVTQCTSHPADLGPPGTVDGSNGYTIAAEGDPLWQVAAAGGLSAEAAKGFHESGLTIRRAQGGLDIGESQLRGHTLLEATTVSMREAWAPLTPATSPTVIFLTSEDDFGDCLKFWNLRALRPAGRGVMPMYLLPADVSSWMSWPGVLFEALKRPAHFSPDVLIVSSSVAEEAMHAFAESMGLQLSEEAPARPFTTGKVPKRLAPFTYQLDCPVHYFAFERRYGETEFVDVPVVGEKTVLRFASPVPTTAAFAGLSLVSISGEPLDALPKREPVAKLVTDSAEWHDEAIQIPDYLKRDWRIELRIPTLAAGYEAVMREVTNAHRLSDKGALGAGLMEQGAIDVLREANVFESIRQLTTPRGEKIAKELEKLFGKGQPLTEEQREFAERFGGRSERTFKCAENLGHGSFEAAQTALERLAGIGWAERGFRTVCGECTNKSFVPFSAEAARGVARCPVCGATTDYTREPAPRGLVVYYRLDGRVDFANDSGVIAHLMVLGTLQRRYKHTFLKPGVDLFFTDGVEGEADVLGVCDGKLVSGEVKMSGYSFTEKQLEKDLDIVQRLRSEIYVMAATSPIEDEAKQRAKARCDELGVQLLLLERDDLLR